LPRVRPAACSLLLLDNRDSFVFNLAQAFLALGAQVEVVRSDRISVAEIAARGPTALVLSPGPGRPEDAGVCPAAMAAFGARLPILGVCLGHQVIGVAAGGTVDRVAPCHGRTSRVHHLGEGLFADLDSPVEAARYHSLAILAEPWPDALVRTAWTDDGVVMAVQHRHQPTYGVQFHPESFLTRDGARILARFLQVAA
jgi:anthranilate synthase/aminodeoxychorismate synthase-like glutamine amidotransferase